MFGKGKEIYGLDYGTFQQFVINCVRFALREAEADKPKITLRGTPGYTPQQLPPKAQPVWTPPTLKKQTRVYLTQEKVDMIRTLAIQKRPRALIASAVGCSESTVSRVLAGKMNRKCK